MSTSTGRWRRRRRLTAIIALSALSLLAPTAAFATEPETSERIAVVTEEVEIKREFLGELSQAAAVNFGTGEIVKPMVDPPGGGCDWSSVSGTFTSFYTNNTLTNVVANYQGNVSCMTTAAGQTMAHLTDIARVYYTTTNTEVDAGTLGECEHPFDNPCTFAQSVGEYNCTSASPAPVFTRSCTSLPCFFLKGGSG